jgi:hypothetical protein
MSRYESRNRIANLRPEINERGQMIVQNPTQKSKSQNEEQREGGSTNVRRPALLLDAVR